MSILLNAIRFKICLIRVHQCKTKSCTWHRHLIVKLRKKKKNPHRNINWRNYQKRFVFIVQTGKYSKEHYYITTGFTTQDLLTSQQQSFQSKIWSRCWLIITTYFHFCSVRESVLFKSHNYSSLYGCRSFISAGRHMLSILLRRCRWITSTPPESVYSVILRELFISVFNRSVSCFCPGFDAQPVRTLDRCGSIPRT